MANHALLNNIEHKDLRVQTLYGPQFGDNVMCTLAIPSEFRHLQADYPILLHRDPTSSQFLPMAVFGFREGENLFLEDSGWQASYVPLMIRRGPFLIGFQGGSNADEEKRMVVSIDMDNPRVGSEGEPLFQPFGGNSDYTDQIVQVLQEIDQGQGAIAELSSVLLAHDLIEPLSLQVSLDSGDSYRFEGFHTVHEEKLASLEGEVLANLSQRGILHCAYMMLASQANLPKLIALKNQRSRQ